MSTEPSVVRGTPARAPESGWIAQLRLDGRLRTLSGTAGKMAELAVAQCAVFAFPLVFAVLCARTLGPAQYGVVSFYTALTAFLCGIIEFGFDTVGVREVHTPERRAHPEHVMWHVTAAKLIVCVVTAGVTVSALLATRNSAEASLFYAVAAYLVAAALEPSWYLRSQERTRPVMLTAGISRVAGIALLVTMVTTRNDLAAAMWTYTFVAWASTLVGWMLMRHLRVIGTPSFELSYLRSLFRSGATILVGNLSAGSLTNGGVAVLGAIADPVVTGTANLALRIRTALVGALVPLFQLGHVRLSNLAGKDRPASIRLGRQVFYLLMFSSMCVALPIIFWADTIAALAYGLPHAPDAAGALVRLMALGLPVYCAGILFGVQALTVYHHERAYVVVQVIAAVLFFTLLLSFPVTTSLNYGWALLAAELWIMLACGLYLRRAVTTR